MVHYAVLKLGICLGGSMLIMEPDIVFEKECVVGGE